MKNEKEALLNKTSNEEDNNPIEILINNKQQSLKEEQVDELLNQIEELDKEFTLLSNELSTIKATSTSKIEERNKLQKLEMKYEMIKKDKHRKLEYIRNILFQNKGNIETNNAIIPDFHIDMEELISSIPQSPLEGIETISSSMKELEYILKNSSINKEKDAEIPHVKLSYLGESIVYYFPDDFNYTVKDLLKDAVDFFISKESNQQYSNYIFTNELSSILVMNVPVIEMYRSNRNLIFVLTDKKNVKAVKRGNKEETNDERKDFNGEKFKRGKENVTKRLDSFLNRYQFVNDNKKKNITQQDKENERDKEEKEKILIHKKTIRKGEIMVKIEKTIGITFLYIIFYLSFIILSLNFILYKKGLEFPMNILSDVQNEFFFSKFTITHNITDYFSVNSKWNVYSMDIDLTETTSISQIGPWLNQIFFNKLAFYSKQFEFIERHKLIGPIRFMQKRVQNAKEISFLTTINDSSILDSFNKTSNTNSKPETESYFPLIDSQAVCSTNSATIWKNEGLQYRQYKHSFSYQGQLANYRISKAFFFDLPQSTETSLLSTFSDSLVSCWIDKKTRLFSIAFNLYQSANSIPGIISVIIYIEIDSNSLLSKTLSVFVYHPFIDFHRFVLDSNSKGFFKALSSSLSTYTREYIYLVVLVIYSSISLGLHISKYKHQKAIVIYNELFQWILSIIVDAWIIAVLIIRIICMIIEYYVISDYIKEGFVSYFPTEFFNGGLFYFLSYMEIIMVILILINLLNAIYIEMFLRVYLTFKYAMKYIAALMIVLILVIMGYALGFNLLFGSYVEMFSTISMSFTSMMKFLFVDFHIMKDMMERYSVVATAFIISYFVLVDFILLNLIFVFLFFAYKKVMKNNTMTLLKYSVIIDGLRNFFINTLLRCARICKLRRKLTRWLDREKKDI